MIAAWLVHAYTASGIVLALLAARAVVDYDFRAAFFWLGLQILIDATDGVLARRARVSEVLPWFDGDRLDALVDYLTYVFVPALCVWRALLVPAGWTLPVTSAMLLSSAYGFSRRDAKTTDHFFLGFPSYWNIVTFYLLVTVWPTWVDAAVLLLLSVLVFVPVRYVYPSRTPVLMATTNVLGAAWAVLMVVLLWQYPDVSSLVLIASFVFPVYYVALSLTLTVRGTGGRADPRDGV